MLIGIKNNEVRFSYVKRLSNNSSLTMISRLFKSNDKALVV